MANANSTRAQDDAPLLSSPAFTRADGALLLLLAALLGIFFWRILTPNPLDRAQFPPGDFTDQFYAFRLYEARAFAEGRIPLWSENFNSGHPFLADIQSAVFYPIALANTLLNVALFNSFSLFALELEALLHFYLAGAFTYLFARRVLYGTNAFSFRAPAAGGAAQGTLRRTFRTARVGAFVSALVFMFGGYLTSYPSLQLAILETAAWLPLALFFVDRATDGRRVQDGRPQGFAPTDLIGAGIVLGVAALAGHPQTFLFVLATTILYFLFRVWQSIQQSKIENRKSKIYLRTIAAIALLALIAFGIAAVQWLPAIEYQQLSTREALAFADAAKGFPTLEILQFILPGYTNAFASPLYVGILPLWLALFALFRRRSETIFWGLLALGALILAFGFYVFAYVVFYLFVPGAALFRDQERLAFVVSFALAMLAGYGMCDLLGEFDARRAKKLFLLLPAGAVIMLVLLLTFFVAGAQNPQPRFAFLGDRAALLLIQFGLASLLVGLYLKKFLNARWFSILAIALILFDLWSVNEPANKGRVEERFQENPLIDLIHQDQDLYRVAADEQLLPGHFGIVMGLEEIGGISPLRLARYDMLSKVLSPRVLALLNVKYAVTRHPERFGEDRIAENDTVYLVGTRKPQPRAWLVGRAVLESDDARALTVLTHSTFDLAREVVLAQPSDISPNVLAVQGTVLARVHAAEHMTLDVNTPADGLLVISENFYPGWRATVDGQPTEILRANLTLRALPVRAGQHRVEMWYDPLSFKLGAALSALTLLTCIGALLYFSTAKRTSKTN